MATSEAFGALSRLELTAAAACVTYVERTQLGKRPPLSPPLREAASATMAIDQATRANLELMRTLAGERRGSLLEAIDQTVTAAGSRLLAQRLSAPLTDPKAINARLDAVAGFADDAAARAETRSRLAAAPDLARALSRLVVGRGGPRDLAAIRDGLLAAAELARALAALKEMPAEIADALRACVAPDGMLAAELSAALAAELPAFKRDGGFVREGYDEALDETRALRDKSRRVVAALQARYADETGIRGLKIRHNNVLGYFVEVTAQHGDKLLAAPHNATFIHRQTLAGQVRFTSTELGELEAKIASAAERALGLELDIFEKLSAAVTAQSAQIKQCAEALAALDVASSLAALAVERDYVRPHVDDGLEFVIEAAATRWSSRRWRATARPSSPMPATCRRPRLRTPAASGSSPARTWRANPRSCGRTRSSPSWRRWAASCRQSTRASASSTGCSPASAPPTISRRGRSTFMVEMVETAAILNQAGPRSLVILDEIGRGTATFDGLSIAWATVEHLHDVNKCRALFATHFHELTVLSARLKRLHNATVRVKEWQGDVVFLHEVVPGSADRSYGIQVAKLAGLPASVIERARTGAGQAGSGRPRQAQRFRGPAAVCGGARRRAAARPTMPPNCSPPPSPRSIPTRCRRARRWTRSIGSRQNWRDANKS